MQGFWEEKILKIQGVLNLVGGEFVEKREGGELMQKDGKKEEGHHQRKGYWGLLVRRLGEMVEEMEEENKENQQWGGNCGKWGVKN